MKRIVITALIWIAVWLIFALPGGTQNKGSSHIEKSADNNKDSTNPFAPAPVQLKSNENTTQSTGVTKQNVAHRMGVDGPVSISSIKDWWDKLLVVFTGIIVFVGGFQIFYLWKTVKATNENALAAKAAADAARVQAEYSRLSAEATKENAIAAKDAAKATRDNVKIFIAKERARIRIEIMPIKPSPTGGFGPPPLEVVVLKVFNNGQTGARVVAAYADICVTTSKENPEFFPNISRTIPINIESFFGPNSEGVTTGIPYLYPFDWDSIDKRRNFVYISGFINYRHLFSEEVKETTFQYVWRVSEVRSGEQDTRPFSYWVQCGEEKDNHQT